MARPSTYTHSIAASICSQLSEGTSLNRICKSDNMPSKSTVYNWLADNEKFLELYNTAREDQADTLADELIEIADNTTGETQRDRLRVDARKWIASKLKPKRYGDKVEQTIAGVGGGPLEITVKHV